ncbi:MAG: hypothetical protein ACFCD0_02230 [Gemmataceae bacterium]
MPMMCPKCRTSSQGRLECATCGTRLQFTARNPTAGDAAWQHTPLGRIVVGLLLSQGFALGLRMLWDSIVLDSQSIDVFTQLLCIQAVSAGCLFIAGLLTGAGQSYGFALGAIVGFTNSMILLGMQVAAGESLPQYLAIGQPIAQSLSGAMGGLVGSLIWRPLPVVKLAKPISEKNSPNAKGRKRSELFSGPIAWIRVLVGSAIVLAGAIFPTIVVKGLMNYTPLQIRSIEQTEFLTYEIAALAALLGALLAGVNTFNGIKQGLCVGLTSAAILFFIRLLDSKTSINEIVFTSGAVIGLTLVGGWFGCRLFPPVVTRRRKGIVY